MAIISKIIVKVVSLELKKVNLQRFSKWFQVAQKMPLQQQKMAKVNQFSSLSQKMGQT